MDLEAVLTSPSLSLMGDSNKVVNYRRDPRNYITQLFGAQLPAIQTGLFNLHMTRGIIVTPHWHTNANELVFVVTGEVLASVFNPFTQKAMVYRLGPGQAAQFPKGWFHWFMVTSDESHILTIFDVPTPDIVYGSDFLRSIPPEIMNRAYCVNPQEYAKAVAPITESLILGPPVGCTQTGGADNSQAGMPASQTAPAQQMPPQQVPPQQMPQGGYLRPPYPAQSSYYPPYGSGGALPYSY